MARLLSLLLLLGLFPGGCATTSDERAEAVFPRGVVAADHAIASQAGLEMLRRGGNAVDAAVATSFCLAVVRPYSCGLGGGGFMVIHLAADEPMPARSVAITYRETAPAAVGPDYYVQLNTPYASRVGPHAVGVPGTVAGLLYALENFGTLDRATVLGPAIAAAEAGFAIDADYVATAEEVLADIAAHPEWVDQIGPDRLNWFVERFLFSGAPKVGALLRQPELAETLRDLARDGAPAFYVGRIAHRILEACPQLTADDLSRYEPRVSSPLAGSLLGRQILAMPLPSSGGIAMLQALGIIERRQSDLNDVNRVSPRYIHVVVEAMKHAFADRAQWLADDRFATVHTDCLLSGAYIDYLASCIDPTATLAPRAYGTHAQAPDDAGTSHLSVVDQWGNAVACTETINLGFGSLTPIPDCGFMLNNEMDDFLTVPGERNAFGLEQSERNLPQPGKWPLSSMSPTIVLDERGAAELVVGGSGGPRIISASLQVLLDVVLFDAPVTAAVQSARFHHQWVPNVLQFEQAWTDVTVSSALQGLGHEVGRRDAIGVVQAIRRARGEAGWSAASDPRKGGQPAGW